MLAVIPIILISCVIVYFFIRGTTEPFVASSKNQSYRENPAYQALVKKLNDRYEPYASGKRPVKELLEKDIEVPDAERILVNFQALACRYPGYLGPMTSGYLDPAIGVQSAVQAGCRVFVLDIDYVEKCRNDAVGYFPRIVVRDSQSKLLINEDTYEPLCNSPDSFQLRELCEAINLYAFSSNAPQASDPVIIVLYFHRKPPGSYKSKAVLDYYSNVAKALAPFQNRLVMNEMEGGKFYRHQQEGKLLTKKMSDYEGRVLIFNNANTSGFTEVNGYPSMEDLDFLTHLRLFTTQTKLGVTEQATGSYFGILQTAEDYQMIPSDRKEQVQADTTLRWTICLPQDPAVPISKEAYEKITSTYGVHCVPIVLFDEANTFMFQEATFKKYGYQFKPKALRYRKPPVVVPGEPNPSMNARGGKLLPPSL